MVTMAKGVASGYAAIACLVTSEDVFELFKDDASDPMNYFRDISTFGGCTAGPAAAIENMAIIEEEGLLDNTLKMGGRMIDNLERPIGKTRCHWSSARQRPVLWCRIGCGSRNKRPGRRKAGPSSCCRLCRTRRVDRCNQPFHPRIQ